jgi:hypothetical protein
MQFITFSNRGKTIEICIIFESKTKQHFNLLHVHVGEPAGGELRAPLGAGIIHRLIKKASKNPLSTSS